jgi:hypothetical protein
VKVEVEVEVKATELSQGLIPNLHVESRERRSRSGPKQLPGLPTGQGIICRRSKAQGMPLDYP